jgi:hypothetical protein
MRISWTGQGFELSLQTSKIEVHANLTVAPMQLHDAIHDELRKCGVRVQQIVDGLKPEHEVKG